MAGLAKGLAIIELFGAGRPRLTIAEAARDTGLTRAAARRCLLTLAGLGYLDTDGKFFRPQPRMLRLGLAYLGTASLPQIAQPILELARDETEESVSLAVLDGDDSVFVARAAAARIVTTGVSLGARLPAYCSATGRVLLGGLSVPALDAYLARTALAPRTERTVTDVGRLRAMVRRALEEGAAYTDEELELGLLSMAVPVRDGAHRIVAAMSLSASSARLSADALRATYLPVLRRHAGMLGRAL
jgi:IclR family pca regulon transcriptional regulator